MHRHKPLIADKELCSLNSTKGRGDGGHVSKRLNCTVQAGEVCPLQGWEERIGSWSKKGAPKQGHVAQFPLFAVLQKPEAQIPCLRSQKRWQLPEIST